MKTLEEIKEDFAKSRGHVSWKAYLELGSTFGGEIAVDLLDFTYSEIAHSYAEQFKPKWIEGYVETLKADLKYSIDLQEQQINENLNRGREEGIKYALEMLVMHLPSAPERKEEASE